MAPSDFPPISGLVLPFISQQTLSVRGSFADGLVVPNADAPDIRCLIELKGHFELGQFILLNPPA
jgi:hypothetical protein